MLDLLLFAGNHPLSINYSTLPCQCKALLPLNREAGCSCHTVNLSMFSKQHGQLQLLFFDGMLASAF